MTATAPGHAASAPTPSAPLETDALIIGAGPAGLFQVFELGLLGIRAHVVDALPHPGGQCIELYADKPIYDIPALAVTTGRQLIEALLLQGRPFQAPLHLGQLVTIVERQADGRLHVATSRGTRFLTRTLFIAAGIGAFQPRTLELDGLARFAGTQLLYSAADVAPLAGERLVVVGGEDAALEAAARFASAVGTPEGPASVTLVHRRDDFRADAACLATVRAARAAGRLRFAAGQASGIEVDGASRLAGLRLLGPEGGTHRLPLERLFVLLGLSPRLGPLVQWGLALERKQLLVDTESFATSERGIFAVGDINTYPGKKKLILSSFHECTLAAFGAAALLFPGQPVHLQYTTTSTRLHRRLGLVADGGAGK